MIYAVAAVLFVQVNNGLGVAPGAIAVSAGFEILAQILVVEDDQTVSGVVAAYLHKAGLEIAAQKISVIHVHATDGVIPCTVVSLIDCSAYLT